MSDITFLYKDTKKGLTTKCVEDMCSRSFEGTGCQIRVAPLPERSVSVFRPNGDAEDVVLMIDLDPISVLTEADQEVFPGIWDELRTYSGILAFTVTVRPGDECFDRVLGLIEGFHQSVGLTLWQEERLMPCPARSHLRQYLSGSSMGCILPVVMVSMLLTLASL